MQKVSNEHRLKKETTNSKPPMILKQQKTKKSSPRIKEKLERFVLIIKLHQTKIPQT
jgi:hypothetical protein